MAKSAQAEPRAGWLGPVLLAVLAVTALRVALLPFHQGDLFVDEAQYWLWGQDLALGYYSKPPLIACMIRVSTELGGDGAFWVRLPGPLLNGATALILADIAARLYGPRAAMWAALTWVTLPMVGLASLLMSTDSVMLPFLALTLSAWVHALDRPTRASAVAAGLALGLGMLGKYAALYALPGMALAALVAPAARLPWRWVGLMLAVLALTISPNVVWNAMNGLSTLQHTLDNADWVRDPGSRATPDLRNALQFLAEQFAVFGPLTMAALVWVLVRGRTGRWQGPLLAMTLPPLVAVTLQAFLSRAYANWAAAAYVAGTLVIVPVLMRHPWFGRTAVGLNAALCAALVAVTVIPGASLNGRPALERYQGRAALSLDLIAAARDAGLDTIVSDNRDLLADLFYTGRDSGLTFRALPAQGRAPHHYALRYSLPPAQPGEVLFASPGPAPACAGAPVATLQPDAGRWRGETIQLWRAPAACLSPGV